MRKHALSFQFLYEQHIALRVNVFFILEQFEVDVAFVAAFAYGGVANVAHYVARVYSRADFHGRLGFKIAVYGYHVVCPLYLYHNAERIVREYLRNGSGENGINLAALWRGQRQRPCALSIGQACGNR